jgi:hypothetical protein
MGGVRRFVAPYPKAFYPQSDLFDLFITRIRVQSPQP